MALLALYFNDRSDLWLVSACAIGAGLAIVAALILLPQTSNRVLMALVTILAIGIALVFGRIVAVIGLIGGYVTPAAEWLLDNFYLIEEEIRIARRHLPRGYSRELPRLTNDAVNGSAGGLNDRR